MAGAVDVVSHTEIERGRNGNTVLHSSYSATSVTRLCSWGGPRICPGEFMASCDSSSEMDIQGSILLNIPELFLHRKLAFVTNN